MNMAFPSMLGLMTEPLMGIFDTILIGQYGTRELAAAAGISTILSSAMWLFNFLSSATTARVAAFHGAKDDESIGIYSVLAFTSAMLIGIILAFSFKIFGNSVIDIYGFPGEVRSFAGDYLNIRLLGIPFTLLLITGIGFFRGLQNALIPMYVSIAANLLNLILDILLIYGVEGYIPKMGIRGAAWATVIAQISGFLILLLFALRKGLIQKYNLYRFKWSIKMFKQLYGTSVHLFMRTFLLLAGFLVSGSVAARMGTVTQAANEIAMKLWLLGSFTIDAFAVAGQALIGTSDYSPQKKYRWTIFPANVLKRNLLYWGIAVGLFFAVVYLLLENSLIGIFTGDERVMLQITLIFPLLVFAQPLNAITFVGDGILIGMEKTKFMMQMMFIAGLIFILFSLLSLKFDWGITGIWWSLTAMMLWRFVTNLYGIRD